MVHFAEISADEHADGDSFDGDLVTVARDVGAEGTILDPCRTTGEVVECEPKNDVACSGDNLPESAEATTRRDSGDSRGPPNRSQRFSRAKASNRVTHRPPF